MRIILKLLAAPFVLALTLLVAVLNFAFSFASWVFCALSFLCLIGALFALFTGDRWGIQGLVIAFAVSPFGLPAVADDSGLCVDALNGGPGVYSARFGGEGLDDKGRYTLLLEMLRGQTDRAAHFHTSIVCAFPNGDELVCEGECPGTIAFAPMGEGGFGYDPVFFVPELRKTFGQLTAEEKASVSHRGKALRAFAAALDDYLKGNE